jgi:hypothetical protein
VRFDRYRVERWLANGEGQVGEPLHFEAIPVSSEDRVAFPYPDGFEVTWPSTKPPFHEDGLISDQVRGGFWLRRYSTQSSRDTEYDVFDSTGKVIRRIRFGERQVVVGVTVSAVYTIRRDEDTGLQWLIRYPLSDWAQ